MTRAAKPAGPSIAGGLKIFDSPGVREETTERQEPDGACMKKAASKSDVADQICEHLRTLYDDVLRQPVPDRFLELLRQLEGEPDSQPSKDDLESRA